MAIVPYVYNIILLNLTTHKQRRITLRSTSPFSQILRVVYFSVSGQ